MSIWGIVLGVLLAIVSVAIIVVIILQEGNQQGIGAVTGVADSYFSKNKARSSDAFLTLDKSFCCNIRNFCNCT